MALGTKLLAGQKLGKYFDTISGTVGRLAKEGTQGALRAGTDKFMAGGAQKDLPKNLRSSATSGSALADPNVAGRFPSNSVAV